MKQENEKHKIDRVVVNAIAELSTLKYFYKSMLEGMVRHSERKTGINLTHNERSEAVEEFRQALKNIIDSR